MTTKNMTATEIGAALARKPSSTECHELVRACEPRRVELRARLSAITPSNMPQIIPDPPAVAEAMLKGPAAVLELNRERELALIELDQLDRLEGLCNAAAQEARMAELRKAIPAAVKSVPALADHVRESLSAFEAAVAALQDALRIVGEFDNAGVPYPFDDDGLAALLELRNRCWFPAQFEVPHNIPPFIEGDQEIPSVPPTTVKNARDEIVRNYPRSYALLYEVRGGANGGTVTVRRSPVSQVPAHERPSSNGDGRAHSRDWPAVV